MTPIPDTKPSPEQVSYFLLENFKCVLFAQIEFMSQAHLGMSEEQLRTLGKEICRKHLIPIVWRKEDDPNPR